LLPTGPNGCAWKYTEGGEWLDECKGSQRPQGVSYYGRGYIQLTWCSNYVQASRALGQGDNLKKNPDSVASNDNLSWGVSAWFWKNNVHGPLGGTDQFGRTTKAINGQGEECQGNGKNKDKSQRRFQFYQKVVKAFNLNVTPNEAGCNY
jgi:chitinase